MGYGYLAARRSAAGFDEFALSQRRCRGPNPEKGVLPIETKVQAGGAEARAAALPRSPTGTAYPAPPPAPGGGRSWGIMEGRPKRKGLREQAIRRAAEWRRGAEEDATFDLKAQVRKLQLDRRAPGDASSQRLRHRSETAHERGEGGGDLVAAPEVEAEGTVGADADGESSYTRPPFWRAPESAERAGRAAVVRAFGDSGALTAIEARSPDGRRRVTVRAIMARSRLSPAPPRRSAATAPTGERCPRRRTTCCGTSAGSTSGRTRRTSSG